MNTLDANDIHRHHGAAALRYAIDTCELEEGAEDQIIPFPVHSAPLFSSKTSISK